MRSSNAMGWVVALAALALVGCDGAGGGSAADGGGEGGGGSSSGEGAAGATGGIAALTGGAGGAGAVASGGGAAGEGATPRRQGPPVELPSARLFAVPTDTLTCHLDRSGELTCWGMSENWALDGTEGPFTSLDLTGDYGCGLLGDGGIGCFGWTPENVSEPPPGEFEQVVTPARSVCARRADDSVACWGMDYYVPPLEGVAVRSLFSANGAVGGLTPSGDAVRWKDDFDFPEITPGPFTALGLAQTHACALREDGTLYCWADPLLGDAPGDPPAGAFAQVVSAVGHSCALDAEGAAVCWGGLYLTPEEPERIAPPEGERFSSLVTGWAHVCGLTLDGRAVCWGYGNADDARSGWPLMGQATPPEGTFVQLVAGFSHTCGLHEDGSVECWGSGQPGDPRDLESSGESTVPASLAP